MYAWLNHTFPSSLTCLPVAWLPCMQKVFLLIYWSIVWLQEGTVTGHCWHYWQWNPQITEGGQRNTGTRVVSWELSSHLDPPFPLMCVPICSVLKTSTTGKTPVNKNGPKEAYFALQFIMFTAIVLWNWASDALSYNAVSFKAGIWGESKHHPQFSPCRSEQHRSPGSGVRYSYSAGPSVCTNTECTAQAAAERAPGFVFQFRTRHGVAAPPSPPAPLPQYTCVKCIV